jgi:amidase
MIGPTTPYASVKHGDFQYVGYVLRLFAIDYDTGPVTAVRWPSQRYFTHWCLSSRYTGIWNILDYTAISFPSGLTADKDIDLLPPNQDTFSELDREVQNKC